MGGYNLKLFSDIFADFPTSLEENQLMLHLTFNQINETSDYSAHSNLSLVRVNADGTKVLMKTFLRERPILEEL